MNSHQKSNCEIILGVDPGTTITGYGLISSNAGRALAPLDFGCIRPPVSRPLTERYRIIFEGVDALILKYAPTALAVETQFISKNPQSGIKLGMARGVIILAATLREIPVFEYAPSRAKRAVVGQGRASKAQVQAMVARLLNLNELPKPEDAADALALAICHSNCAEQKYRI